VKFLVFFSPSTGELVDVSYVKPFGEELPLCQDIPDMNAVKSGKYASHKEVTRTISTRSFSAQTAIASESLNEI